MTNPSTSHTSHHDLPLTVDLDGTLVFTDMLYESAVDALRHRPLASMRRAPAALLSGKARLKEVLASLAAPDVANLPFNWVFIDWLRLQVGRRRIVLATAADRSVAEVIAAHLGIFDEVIASDGEINLKGRRKARALVERFGERGFDHAGNDRHDAEVWKHSRAAVVVNAGERLEARVRGEGVQIAEVFKSPTQGYRAWLKAIRLHQWLKNLLIFVPLLAAHQFANPGLIVTSVIAFLAFGLCASSVYLLNDLSDLRVDRLHPRKRLRPFAAGRVSIPAGVFSTVGLLVLAFGLALFTTPAFMAVLAAYWLLTTAYSFVLKRVVLVDVITLAGLYTVRIIAGAAAISIMPSYWLLAVSMFVFFSLALLKRSVELRGITKPDAKVAGRGYRKEDTPILDMLGVATGCIGVLVFALYINSPESRELYRHHDLLWLACPPLLLWISRMWLVANRGEMHDDPVVYAALDRTSHVLGAVTVAIFLLAA